MEITIKSLDTIHEAAKEFVKGMGDGKVFAFYGKIGCRKDYFYQGSLRGLGRRRCYHLPYFRYYQRIYGWQRVTQSITLTSIVSRSWKRYMTWDMRTILQW